MPLRDYACDVCSHQQEALVRNAADEADLRCERCGSMRLTRQLSAPARTGGGSDCATAAPGGG